jgi:hypothetical protein
MFYFALTGNKLLWLMTYDLNSKRLWDISIGTRMSCLTKKTEYKKFGETVPLSQHQVRIYSLAHIRPSKYSGPFTDCTTSPVRLCHQSCQTAPPVLPDCATSPARLRHQSCQTAQPVLQSCRSKLNLLNFVVVCLSGWVYQDGCEAFEQEKKKKLKFTWK